MINILNSNDGLGDILNGLKSITNRLFDAIGNKFDFKGISDKELFLRIRKIKRIKVLTYLSNILKLGSISKGLNYISSKDPDILLLKEATVRIFSASLDLFKTCFGIEINRDLYLNFERVYFTESQKKDFWNVYLSRFLETYKQSALYFYYEKSNFNLDIFKLSILRSSIIIELDISKIPNFKDLFQLAEQLPLNRGFCDIYAKNDFIQIHIIGILSDKEFYLSKENKGELSFIIDVLGHELMHSYLFLLSQLYFSSFDGNNNSALHNYIKINNDPKIQNEILKFLSIEGELLDFLNKRNIIKLIILIYSIIQNELPVHIFTYILDEVNLKNFNEVKKEIKGTLLSSHIGNIVEILYKIIDNIEDIELRTKIREYIQLQINKISLLIDECFSSFEDLSELRSDEVYSILEIALLPIFKWKKYVKIQQKKNDNQKK